MIARLSHVNLVASDWQALAAFYIDVFGCERVEPERHLRGAWLDAATAVPNAAIHGVHLRLPMDAQGNEDGPTLEIFSYETMPDHLGFALNRPGLGHLAFSVDDVESALERLLRAGGSQVGALTHAPIKGSGTVTFVYAADPEGNVIELQSWEK